MVIRLSRLRAVNAYLVREDDGFTVIDTMLPGSERAIIGAAERRGAPIRRILLTHAHNDHVGSLDALAGALREAEVLIGAREARLLAGDMTLDPDEPQDKLRGGYPQIATSPTRTLEPGDRVGSLEVHAAPGHTPGQIALFDPRDGTLYCADAYATIGSVATSAKADWRSPLPAVATWHKPTALETARRLRELDPRGLAPGARQGRGGAGRGDGQGDRPRGLSGGLRIEAACAGHGPQAARSGLRLTAAACAGDGPQAARSGLRLVNAWHARLAGVRVGLHLLPGRAPQLQPVEPLAGFGDVVLVGLAPVEQRRQRQDQRLARVGQLVLHARGYARVDVPQHEPVALELAQRRRQHPPRHAIDLPQQLIEPVGTAAEAGEHRDAPLRPEHAERPLQGVEGRIVGRPLRRASGDGRTRLHDG